MLIMKDLKPSNILSKINPPKGQIVSASNVQLKIVDYGFFGKFVFTNIKKFRHGGLYFIPPEVIKKEDPDSDLWSVGVILCLLLTGKPPFDGKDRKSLVASILQHKSNLTEEEYNSIPEDAKDLMK